MATSKGIDVCASRSGLGEPRSFNARVTIAFRRVGWVYWGIEESPGRLVEGLGTPVEIASRKALMGPRRTLGMLSGSDSAVNYVESALRIEK